MTHNKFLELSGQLVGDLQNERTIERESWAKT